jgi:ABC-type antimicrobial peptide transport system permease subunit
MTAAAAAGSSHALGTSVHERRREIGVLRSAGATRGGVVSLIVGEAAVVGAVAGIAGVAAGWLLSAAADASLAVLLPPFPFKPEHFFAWSPAAGLAAVLLSTVFCAAGGVVPAVRAARMDPAEALRS